MLALHLLCDFLKGQALLKLHQRHLDQRVFSKYALWWAIWMPCKSVAFACFAFVFELQVVDDLLWLWICDFLNNVVSHAGGLIEGGAAVVAGAFVFGCFGDVD